MLTFAEKVTTPPAGRLHEVEEHCPRPGCVVGAPRPGEFCEIVGGAVRKYLIICALSYNPPYKPPYK